MSQPPPEVPPGLLYGPQTALAVQHFAIGEARLPVAMIHAYGVIKQATARVNGRLGVIDPAIAEAICHAAQELAAGELDEHFPLGPWQSGSGTQSHMNVNEVLANRAAQLLPGGADGPSIHPNDHVNRGQSTNDTFPSALHVALVEQVHMGLLPAVDRLTDTLKHKSTRFADRVKIGRTHLQDATPITLGQEISAWVTHLEVAQAALVAALGPLHELALGGTAVGTGLNAHPDFARLTAEEVARLTGRPFMTAPNKFAQLAGHDACVGLSSALRLLAVACTKLANDVRWLASGPRCGLGELSIPENEPGSSIMPGKVNPTQCEALTMVAARVLGNDVSIGFAASQGAFQLNVYKPLIATCALESVDLLADGCRAFERYCARGIEANEDVMAEHLERSLMLVTALAPEIGYDAAARAAKHAHANDLSLRQAVVDLRLMAADRFDALVIPGRMTRPG